MKENGQNSRALIVIVSSPYRRNGSTLRVMPSISPTPGSIIRPPLPCVPAVISPMSSWTDLLGVMYVSAGEMRPGEVISMGVLDGQRSLISVAPNFDWLSERRETGVMIRGRRSRQRN